MYNINQTTLIFKKLNFRWVITLEFFFKQDHFSKSTETYDSLLIKELKNSITTLSGIFKRKIKNQDLFQRLFFSALIHIYFIYVFLSTQ